MIKYNFFVIIALFGLALIARAEEEEKSCDDLKQEAEECTRQAVYKFLTEDLPTNDEQMQSRCALVKDNLICAKKYRNKCVKRLPGTMFNILLRNALKVMKKHCNTEEGRAEFLRHSRCLSQENKPDVIQQFNRFQSVQLYIANIEDDNDLLPAFCCGLEYLTVEVEKEFKKHCLNTTGQETVDYLTDNIESSINDIKNLFCTKFDHEAECDGRFKHINDGIIEAATPPVNYDIETQSLLNPLIAMAERMTAI